MVSTPTTRKTGGSAAEMKVLILSVSGTFRLRQTKIRQCQTDRIEISASISAQIRDRQGVPAREGAWLVVFPCPNRRQSEKATSRDPPPRAGTPCPFPLLVRGGGVGVPARREVGGPGPKGGRGPGSWCSSAVRVQEAWEYHEPGTPPRAGYPPTSRVPPHEPGPLAFSQLCRREENPQKGAPIATSQRCECSPEKYFAHLPEVKKFVRFFSCVTCLSRLNLTKTDYMWLSLL